MEKDHGQENIQNEVGEEISTSIRKEVARDMMNQRWATPEWREKMSKRGSELWQDIEYRTNILSSIDRDKQKEVARRTMKKNWEDPEFRKKASEHSFESQRISARVSMTQNWRDPKWVEFMRQKKRKVSTDIIEIFSISGMLQKDIEQILGLSQSKVANVVFRMRKANKFWENRTRDEPAVTFLAGLILNGFIMKDEISVLDINPSLEAHRLKKNLHL
ncbi:MAG TPA: hypothetical protein VK338_04445, partial [Candidatus Nitrosocosmicus sp.]|nr:hypothetical protein [Candidatus Nitrosocosmicus sp.]